MKYLLQLAAASLLTATGAQAQTFGFEGLGLGSYTSLSETQGTLTATVTRTNGVTFDLYDIGSDAPGFGNRTLGNFNSLAFNPFVVDFSAGVSSVAVSFGDFAPSDADDLFLSIYSGLNGSGALLGTATAFYDGNTGFPTIATLSLMSGTAIRSAVFNGGSSAFPSSIFADNISVTAIGGTVPEPATWAMMIGGIGMVGGAMRRRKVATTVSFA